jgi:hypothetical protein
MMISANSSVKSTIKLSDCILDKVKITN